VVIVNERLAARFWPGADALGRRLQQWRGQAPIGRPVEIVGIARDSQYATLGEAPRANVYRPLTQDHQSGVAVLVAAHGDPAALWPDLDRAIQQLDPDVALFDVRPMTEAASISLLPARAAGILAAILGGVALLLAALGTYGLLNQLVQQRQSEISIRMALGCPAETVVRMIVRQALRWAAAGILIGLALAFALTGFAATLLYGVSPRDPLSFAIVPIVLAVVVWMASAAPARRASRLNPAIVLR
jgi:predicted lysophospholipase L1 biosynthesis ABC-type transport system permease subunit